MGASDLPGEEFDLHTGVTGLDDVLAGGLTSRRLYLLEGAPGTSKTTIALQFLMEGAARGVLDRAGRRKGGGGGKPGAHHGAQRLCGTEPHRA